MQRSKPLDEKERMALRQMEDLPTRLRRSRSLVYASQKEKRVALVAQALYYELVAPDYGRWLAKTGSILERSCLRSKVNKAAFQKIIAAAMNDGDDCEGRRFWTKAMVSSAIERMVYDYGLNIPMLPGFEWSAWLKEQTAQIHTLCKRAQRNSKGVMDNLQTLPMDVEEDLLCCLLFASAAQVDSQWRLEAFRLDLSIISRLSGCAGRSRRARGVAIHVIFGFHALFIVPCELLWISGRRSFCGPELCNGATLRKRRAAENT